MLKLIDGYIHWEREDKRTMVKIIGPEFAQRGKNKKPRPMRVPYNAAILKLADRLGLELSKKCQRNLEAQISIRKGLERLKKHKDAPPNGPFAKQFFPWQRADLEYIDSTRLPAYLVAHDPGVGKTLVAIRWAAALRPKRVLVICPNSAKEQWRDEIISWWLQPDMVESMGEPTILEGSSADQCVQATKNGIVIAHWESLVHARIGLLQKPWDVIIADEAHNAQNRHAQRTETLWDFERRYAMALTAHPYTKTPEDFFAILKFLYPKQYSAYWRYFNMHVDYDVGAFGKYLVDGPRRPKLLRWEIAPFTLRRTKGSLGWKPPAIIKRTIELSSKARKEYDKLRKQFFAELEGRDKQLVIPSDLARVTRMRQYLIDPGLVGGSVPSAKYPVIAEIMGELNGPPVIFTEFKQAAYRLDKFLRSKGFKRLGHINGDTRDVNAVKKDFVAGRLDGLIVVIKAGGESLNLGGHGYIIVLDLPWHPRGWQQLLGRVDRPKEGSGSIVPVTAYPVLVRDSYETKRMKLMLERRHKNFSKVFVSDLKELFA